jgi:putative 4-mercaptohistidine N1-methyltranferase
MKSNIYETSTTLSQYLLFHYKSEKENVSFPFKGLNNENFPTRCVKLCRPLVRGKKIRSLDLGCAVGRSTFELTRFSSEVIGIDYSAKFIETANLLKKNQKLWTETIIEGALEKPVLIKLPKGIYPEKVYFEQGDAEQLRTNLGEFDLVLMANLIDRLKNPRRCLEQMPLLVKKHGILMITSPYTWLEEFTEKKNWLGGIQQKPKNIQTLDTLKKILNPNFILLKKLNVPFLIREHARKYQWGVSEATVWRRKAC